MKMPPRSIFARMPLEGLVGGARLHPTRAAYLAALGFKKRHALGLELRMIAEGLSHTDLWPTPHAKERRETHHALDLQNDTHAYFYGLALADGHLRQMDRGRGNVAIGLASRDDGVLLQLSASLPWKSHISRRSRRTNFGPHETTELRLHSASLRKQLLAAGFTPGSKSKICAPPITPYCATSFWRGFVDGDGSLGITGDGYPFVSLVTSSANIAAAYKTFLSGIGIPEPKSRPNARDGVWNIMVVRKNAALLAAQLYGSGNIALDRKRQKSLEILGC
jgi:hypothetical protein